MNPALPNRRVVLLGASNLTRGIATVAETAARVWGRPLQLVAALGHGRSFGLTSSFLGRRLPGILQSGLWGALDAGGALPTAALVTDIGNDILYEVPVAQLASWLEACFDRLAATATRTAVTRLPLENLAGLSERRFRFFRRLFVPGCTLSLAEIARRVAAVEKCVERLARERGFALVGQRREWYGLDPLHLRTVRWPAAWGEILAAWSGGLPPRAPRAAPLRWLYLRTRRPAEWARGARTRRAAQPCGKLSDGSTVALY